MRLKVKPRSDRTGDVTTSLSQVFGGQIGPNEIGLWVSGGNAEPQTGPLNHTAPITKRGGGMSVWGNN